MKSFRGKTPSIESKHWAHFKFNNLYTTCFNIGSAGWEFWFPKHFPFFQNNVFHISILGYKNPT